MRNFVAPGHVLTLTASRAVASGDGMLRGNTFGVATGTVANGAVGEFQADGVFELPKAAVTIAEGVLLYWDNTAFNVTTTAASNPKIGTAAAVGSTASGVATIAVRLIPTI